MSGFYHDEPIPCRGRGREDRRHGSFPAKERYSAGSGDRSFGHVSRSRDSGSRTAGSSWTYISEEELYGRRGSRENRTGPENRNLPEKMRKLLEMTKTYETDDRKRTEAFLEQAAYMADYEDNYRMRSIPVRHIFVAYQEMQPDELRGYFAWRTRIRRGESVPGGRDFIRLYTAELINLIGVSSAQEAFDRLLRLQASAGASDALMADASLKHVLRDFIIAHDLGHDLAGAYCIDDPEMEMTTLGLSHADTVDDYTLYTAIRSLVKEQIEGSRFLPQIEEDACHVIARTVRRLSAKERMQKGKGLTERILGPERKKPHTMFSWLPFCTTQPDGYRYEVDPVRAYEYSGDTWYCCGYSSYRNPDEIRNLAGIVRECERLLRKTFHYKNVLPDRRKDPQTAALISDVIRGWMEEKARRMRPEIRIDLKKLSGIRAAADITRERLLEGTEDAQESAGFSDLLWDAMPKPPEMAGAIPELPETADTEPETRDSDDARPISPVPLNTSENYAMTAPLGRDSARTGESSVFTADENEFLRLLLEGKPWKDFISEKQLMLSVFADSINEKAYDILGDTILEIEDGIPALVSDYLEDVKQMTD